MSRIIIVILITISFLTIIDINLVTYFKSNSLIYFIIFILNILSFLMLSQFTINKRNKLPKEERKIISEFSMRIFIRIFVFFSPIVALFGLYIVSFTKHGKALGIDDAGNWISFVLGIASFVMALVSMWQSEGTYNRIFNGIDKIVAATNEIKKNTDVKGIIEELGQKPNNLKPASEVKSKDSDDSDGLNNTLYSKPKFNTETQIKMPDQNEE